MNVCNACIYAMYVPACVYTYVCMYVHEHSRARTHTHVTNHWINTATPPNSVINCTGTNYNLPFMTMSFVYSVEWLNGNK